MAGSGVYDAFISYSHAGETPFAEALQNALHRLAKPVWQRRAMRVYRDATDLGADPALWPRLVEALDTSEHIVVLASPDLARSEWSNKESAHWIAGGRADRMFLVLVGGDIVWSDARGGFDPERSTALPPALTAPGIFDHEPVYLDARAVGVADETELDLRNAAFRDVVVSLAAPIRGIPKADLDGLDLREHRRLQRYRTLAIGALSTLVIAALALAGWALVEQRRANQAEQDAIEQRDRAVDAEAEALDAQAEAEAAQAEAVSERDRAERAQADAEAREFAARAVASDDLGEALILAVEAQLRTPEPLFATRDVYAQVTHRIGDGAATRAQIQYLADVNLFGAVSGDWSDDGRWAASGNAAGEILVFDALEWGPPSILRTELREVRSLDWRPGTHEVAVGGKDGVLLLVDADALVAGTAEPLTLVGHGSENEGNVESLAWTADGRHLLSAGWDGTVRLWSSDGELLDTDFVADTLLHSVDTRTRDDRTDVVVTGDHGEVVVWRLQGDRLTSRRTIHQYPAPARAAMFSPIDDLLAVGGHTDDYRIEVLQVGSGETVAVLRGHVAPVLDIAWAPDGRLATGSDEARVLFWDVSSEQVIDSVPTPQAGWSLRWSTTGEQLMVADGRLAELFDTPRPTPDRRVGGDGHGIVRGLAVSADGSFVAAGDDRGRISIWEGHDRTDVDISASAGVIAMSWAPEDGSFVAATSAGEVAEILDDGTIAWRVDTGAEALSIAWDRGSTSIAVGYRDGSVRVFDRAGTERSVLGPAPGAVQELAFSPDGTRLVTIGGPGTIWDLATGEATPWAVWSDQPRSVTWSEPDLIRMTISERVLLTGAPDEPPQEIFLDVGDILFSAAQWSPDGRLVVAAGAFGPPRLIDVQEGRFIGLPLAGTGTEGEVVAWSADSRTVVVTDRVGLVRVWTAIGEAEACRRGQSMIGFAGVELDLVLGPDRGTAACSEPDEITELAPIPSVAG